MGFRDILLKSVVDLNDTFDIILLPSHNRLVVRQGHYQSACVAIVVPCKVVWFVQHVVKQLSGFAILEGLVTNGLCWHCHLMNEFANSAPTICEWLVD